MIVMSILIFFLSFSAFSPKFGKLFGEVFFFGKVVFRQNGFSAMWVSAKCRASGNLYSYAYQILSSIYELWIFKVFFFLMFETLVI